MAMVVQHNLSAINANNKMNMNVAGLKKSTEKLSSGYQINRAGDNAAGLAISEKMRSQIRGLSQATKNAQDGISLIQTAEGGLNETHSILQRMRELAVQSANGTYTQEDRDAIQLEADALKDEIDRISTSTEYNTQQLLDGSLSGGGKVTEYGALFGSIEKGLAIGGGQITVTSSMQGVSLKFTTGASGAGGENAVWNKEGTELTINLKQDVSYKDDEIQKLIDNATVDKANTAHVPEVTFKSEYGVVQGAVAQTGSHGNPTLDQAYLEANKVAIDAYLTAAADTSKDTAATAAQIKAEEDAAKALTDLGMSDEQIAAIKKAGITGAGTAGATKVDVTDATAGGGQETIANALAADATAAPKFGTVAGIRQVMTGDLTTLVANGDKGGINSSDTIKLTANTYGAQEQYKDAVIKSLTIKTDVGAGKESVDATAEGDLVLHVSTGVEYSEKDIEDLLKAEGYDYSVELTDSKSPDGAKDGTVYFNNAVTDPDKYAPAAAELKTATDAVAALTPPADATAAGAATSIKTLLGSFSADADIKAELEKIADADYSATSATVTGLNGIGANAATVQASIKALFTEDKVKELLATAKQAASGEATINPVDLTVENDGIGVGKNSVGSVGKGLTFQIGANGVEDQRVTLNIDDMSAAALGVDKVDVSDRDKANAAIDTIDKAISKVSMQRAGLGALQNRLEYTVNNLTTTNENLTNAESSIRDTDMATEMISYTKYNILQQASQAMLAQANQQPQAVLQLLG